MVPDLTIITVCRNAVDSIESTIESVLRQKNACIEFIVIDGASTDGTLEVLSRYQEKLDCLVSEPDRGIYDAMNKGLDRAHGQLVFFLNAKDTLIDEHVAERVISEYRNGNPEILYGDVMVTDSSGNVERRVSYQDWDLARFFEGTICHQGVFAAREAFQICGKFEPDYRFAADLDWLLSALRTFRLRARYLAFPVANFDNGGVSSDRDAKMNELLRAEMNDAIGIYFSRTELFVFKVARRLRLRRIRPAWKSLAALMRWNLRA